MTDESKQINITAQPSADPDVCKFTVDQPLFPDGSFNCRSTGEAKGSPLLEALFAIEGVSQAFIRDNSVAIAKSTDAQWPVLGTKIGSAIREQILSGKPLLATDLKKHQPDEKEIRKTIEQLFKDEINPSFAAHGGFVELVDVKGTQVFVTMGGGCQGCSSAKATLKFGIERAIKDKVPEVTEVIDMTDHSGGDNPYYKK